MIESAVRWLFAALALPAVGLPTVFTIAFLSATLLPLASEPAVFAVIKSNPSLLWPAVLAATAGNTLGGAFDYWLGFGARKAVPGSQENSRWFGWLQRFGAKTLLLAWLPVIGDPLCVLAGWLKLPFWLSLSYIAMGKFFRYALITWLLLHIPEGIWHQIGAWLG